MRAEWHRRLLSIAYTVTLAACSRKIEPTYVKLGLDPVWTTRIFAIALLILCFKLTDKIPDESWPNWRLEFHVKHAMYLLIIAIWVAVVVGISGDRAH